MQSTHRAVIVTVIFLTSPSPTASALFISRLAIQIGLESSIRVIIGPVPRVRVVHRAAAVLISDAIAITFAKIITAFIVLAYLVVVA